MDESRKEGRRDSPRAVRATREDTVDPGGAVLLGPTTRQADWHEATLWRSCSPLARGTPVQTRGDAKPGLGESSRTAEQGGDVEGEGGGGRGCDPYRKTVWSRLANVCAVVALRGRSGATRPRAAAVIRPLPLQERAPRDSEAVAEGPPLAISPQVPSFRCLGSLMVCCRRSSSSGYTGYRGVHAGRLEGTVRRCRRESQRGQRAHPRASSDDGQRPGQGAGGRSAESRLAVVGDGEVLYSA